MDSVTRRRFRGIWIGTLLLVAVFTLQLLRLQRQGGVQSGTMGKAATTYYLSVPAARGDILDRNGTPLVADRACYDVSIINFVFLNNGEPNEKIRQLPMRVQGNGGMGHILFRVVRMSGNIRIDRGDFCFTFQLFQGQEVQQGGMFFFAGKEFFCFRIRHAQRQDRQIDLTFSGNFHGNFPDMRIVPASQPESHDQITHNGVFFCQCPQIFLFFQLQNIKCVHHIAGVSLVPAIPMV